MLETKPHYFLLEKDKLEYAIPFKSLSNHTVYARLKDNKLDNWEGTPFTEIVPQSDYSFYNGNIAFSKVPCTLWEYDAIKIVENNSYIDRETEFNGNRTITSESLNKEFNNIITHVQNLEKNLQKQNIFLDDESPEFQKNLPKLLEDTFWVFKNKAIVAFKLDYLKDEYNNLGSSLETKYNELSDKLYSEFKEYLNEICLTLNEKTKQVFDYYSEKMLVEYSNILIDLKNKIIDIIDNISQQRWSTTSTEDTNTITVPNTFYITNRACVYVNGLLKTIETDYSISDDNIIFVSTLATGTKIDIIDNMPPTYVEEQKKELIELSKKVFCNLENFIENNKCKLKGKDGRDGKDGISVVVDKGFAFEIENGNLYLLYPENGFPPDFHIDNEGNLIQTFEGWTNE